MSPLIVCCVLYQFKIYSTEPEITQEPLPPTRLATGLRPPPQGHSILFTIGGSVLPGGRLFFAASSSSVGFQRP